MAIFITMTKMGLNSKALLDLLWCDASVLLIKLLSPHTLTIEVLRSHHRQGLPFEPHMAEVTYLQKVRPEERPIPQDLFQMPCLQQ